METGLILQQLGSRADSTRKVGLGQATLSTTPTFLCWSLASPVTSQTHLLSLGHICIEEEFMMMSICKCRTLTYPGVSCFACLSLPGYFGLTRVLVVFSLSFVSTSFLLTPVHTSRTLLVCHRGVVEAALVARDDVSLCKAECRWCSGADWAVMG